MIYERAPGRCGWFQLYDCHHILLIKLFVVVWLAHIAGSRKLALLSVCVSPNRSSALFHFSCTSMRSEKWLQRCGWRSAGHLMPRRYSASCCADQLESLNLKLKIQMFKHWEPYLFRSMGSGRWAGVYGISNDGFNCLRADTFNRNYTPRASEKASEREWKREASPARINGEKLTSKFNQLQRLSDEE